MLTTQRVVFDPAHGERRDALDQRWAPFLAACGLFPVPVPNSLAAALALCDAFPKAPILLTGGNDLAALGGDAPERDAVERRLLDRAAAEGRPVLGVCRGMQMLLHAAGVDPVPVAGHVARRHGVRLGDLSLEVNSFHGFGFRRAGGGYTIWGTAEDATVEAVRHDSLPFTGIMWHPEREAPFRAIEAALVGGALRAERLQERST